MEVRNLKIIGQLVASAGSRRFFSRLNELLVKTIAFDYMHAAEWVVDRGASTVVSVNDLGNHGFDADRHERHMLSTYYGYYSPEHPVVQQVIHMDDTRLILATVRHAAESSLAKAPTSLSQCSLAYCRSNRRYLISIYRATDASFELRELAFLKEFSDLLLPVVEQHAMTLGRKKGRDSHYLLRPDYDQPNALVQKNFADRLQQEGIVLSQREMEVCVASLMGRTVPQVASELELKSSTVETYIKRAAIKLGVSGRHGLARWLADGAEASIASFGAMRA